MPTLLAGRMWLAGLVLGRLVLLAAPLAAQVPANPMAEHGGALSGRVERPATWDMAALEALPPTTLQMTRTTPQGVRTTSYTGALLWTLVSQAGLAHEAGLHSHLRHTLMARGRDGYVVALAIAELDPDFEGKQVLIAYAQDGKPLPDLRLIVPADAKPGRSVRDIVAVEIR